MNNTINAIRLPILAATDGERVYTSDGREILISRRPGATLPGGLLAEACSRNGIGQLWFATGADFSLDSIDHYGWDFQQGAETAAWVHTFKRTTNLVVELVRPILDRLSPWETRDPRALLNGLMLYRDLVGITYHHSPAATSRELLIGLHLGHKHNVPLTAPALPPPALDVRCEEPLSWIADHVTCKLMAPRKYLHAYDKNAAYLGAASNLALGTGMPEHLSRVNEADCKLPGYFLVDQHPEQGIPTRIVRPRTKGQSWVTTPTVQFMAERYGKLPAVHEAYVWLDHRQPLQPWYKVIRDARGALLSMGSDDPGVRLALAAVKLSYSSLLGGYLASTKWDRTGDVLYRPDIRHMVIATARTNLVRKALACQDAGYPPLAMAGVDTLYFLSDEADPVAACPPPVQLGTMLSQYKVKLSCPATDAIRTAICDGLLPDSGRLAALGALRSEALR